MTVWVLCDCGLIVDVFTDAHAALDAYEDHLVRVYAWDPEVRGVGPFAVELFPTPLNVR